MQKTNVQRKGALTKETLDIVKKYQLVAGKKNNDLLFECSSNTLL